MRTHSPPSASGTPAPVYRPRSKPARPPEVGIEARDRLRVRRRPSCAPHERTRSTTRDREPDEERRRHCLRRDPCRAPVAGCFPFRRAGAATHRSRPTAVRRSARGAASVPPSALLLKSSSLRADANEDHDERGPDDRVRRTRRHLRAEIHPGNAADQQRAGEAEVDMTEQHVADRRRMRPVGSPGPDRCRRAASPTDAGTAAAASPSSASPTRRTSCRR